MDYISELKKEELQDFFEYLRTHIAENGLNGVLFQPLTKEQSILDSNWEKVFEGGFIKKYGEMGWRKIWVARNQDHKIVGHVDIRSRKELNTIHRVLLGMGVDSQYRNLKIGQKLLEYAIEYCKSNSSIAWLDLDVMVGNDSAISIYEKYNFLVTSKVEDMFRINNKSYGMTSMTLSVKS